MTLSPSSWSIRSVLVSVRDLAQSVAFYSDVFGLPEIGREGEVAVVGSGPGSFALMLREVPGHGVGHGQQELGPRALTFDVGSQAELDAVAERLKVAGALISRSPLHQDEPFEIVTGRDPDGLPLLFITYESAGPLHADHFRHVSMHMYGVDV